MGTSLEKENKQTTCGKPSYQCHSHGKTQFHCKLNSSLQLSTPKQRDVKHRKPGPCPSDGTSWSQKQPASLVHVGHFSTLTHSQPTQLAVFSAASDLGRPVRVDAFSLLLQKNF